MCGIVGAVARRNVVPILLEGLRRLEYRGYDSAGIAVVNGSAAAPAQHRARRASSARLRRRATSLTGHDRHRAHALGHARRAHGAQRAPARLAAASRWCTTASSRTTRRCARTLQRAGLRVRLRDRHRGDRAPGPFAHRAQGCGLLEAVRRSVAELHGRLRDRRHRRGGPGAAGGGAHGRAAAARPGRRRELRRLRHLRAAAGHAARGLPRGRRLRRGDARRRAHRRRARAARVERPVHVSELTADAVELGHVPALHAEGDLRAAARRSPTRSSSRSTRAAIAPQLFGAEAERIFARGRQRC